MNLDIYRRIVAGEALAVLLSPRALWRLSGPDAARYLNGQVTLDIPRLAENTVGYAAVCTAKGRMEGDVSIALHGGGFYLDAEPSLHESLGARLDKYLIADDAAFEDLSDSWHLVHVFGVNPPTAPQDGFVVSHARFGLPGHDIWSASPIAPVEPALESGIIETLRVEHCIPKWGTELGPNTLPPEAGPHMLAAISYTKGCYVGQETIARLKSVGHVNRTLVLLKSDSANFPAMGAKLTHEDRDSGTVTSSCFSPHFENGIALAYVPRQLAAEGTILLADGLSLTVTVGAKS